LAFALGGRLEWSVVGTRWGVPSYYLPLLTAGLKAVIACLLILAAFSDIMTRTVPNWMPVALAIFGAALASFDLRLAWGLSYGLGIFLLSLFCWRRGWMGGADVKLLGASAIIVAPAASVTFLLAVSLSGGVLASVYLAGRFVLPRPAARRPRHLLPRVLRVEAWRIRHRGPLPYACAIATGTILVMN
jgi:prepilin peptidase CpaA